tara:strand:- start:2428 stop:2979 length:552 start_codon:yes stop_codon:yes gene_type:complete
MIYKKIIPSLFSILVLSGCVSNNIKSFKVDTSIDYEIKNKNIKPIYLLPIKPSEDDPNSILCRMAGEIYLPKKMTYSQYLNDAFQKTLSALKIRSDSARLASHVMEIELTEVSFSSLQGEWYINAFVRVDNNSPIEIKSLTEFGTSYYAVQACRNTAESFDEAAANFISQILNHSKIAEMISQ